MDLTEFFGSEYIEIKATDKDVISFFIEEDKETGKMKYIKPLETVFMHKTFNEMYLILDCGNQILNEIKEAQNLWENNVLSYVNFGEEYLQHKRYLKYNTILTIMCKDLPQDEDDIFRYESEKSKYICRKIFILVDDNGEVLDNNKTMLPFYFKPIEDIENNTEEEYENKLKSILPKDEILKKILESKEDFSEEDEKLILGWLEKNE